MAAGQIKDLIYKVRLIISRMKEGIKVIVFDVGGVLQDERYSREQLRKKRLGVHNFMIKNLKQPEFIHPANCPSLIVQKTKVRSKQKYLLIIKKMLPTNI